MIPKVDQLLDPVMVREGGVMVGDVVGGGSWYATAAPSVRLTSFGPDIIHFVPCQLCLVL